MIQTTTAPRVSIDSPESLHGRVALVTGGGSGIGKAVSEAMARAGATVHLAGRSSRVEQAARDLAATEGRTVVAHRGSIAEPQFCERMIASIEREGAGVDILVNAAAVLGPVGPLWELPAHGIAEAVGTNLLGTAYCMRFALPGMLARGFGRVVNFAGGGAAYGYPKFSPYASSKCAVVRLTETVAQEIATPNVTVNVIAPGAVETEMLASVRRHGGEVRTVTDIAEPVRLVLYLASGAAAGINGRFLHVRDDYRDPELYRQRDMLTLRRVERR